MYVKDWDLFVTVQLLEDTPPVLFLGKLREDHGCSYERVAGQKRDIVPNRNKILCETDNYVPDVVLGLSSEASSSSSASTPDETPPQDLAWATPSGILIQYKENQHRDWAQIGEDPLQDLSVRLEDLPKIWCTQKLQLLEAKPLVLRSHVVQFLYPNVFSESMICSHLMKD